ncbi:LptF/LptG family permease [bacterium]|nr:LptF/LptG family permease [bacterium]
MKVLDRYIIRELIPPFIGSLTVILFVLILDFLLKILNLIIAKGVPVFAVGKLFVYNLSWMFLLAMPMAALMASLMVFGKFSQDREITAAKSLGIPFWRMLIPAAFAMALLSIVMILFGDKIVPNTNFESKILFSQIHRKKPMAVLQARIFIDEFPGIVLYIDRIDDKSEKLYGVTLYEKRTGGKPRTITAPEGEIHYDNDADAIKFTLYNGVIHDIDPDDPTRYTLAEFDKQVINISDLGTKLGDANVKHRGDRELSIAMIKAKIVEQETILNKSRQRIRKIITGAIDSIFIPRRYNSKLTSSSVRRAMIIERKRYIEIRKMKFRIKNALYRIRKLATEHQKKYSLPLACLIFLLVGAPVGAWTRKGGLGIAVGLSFGFFLLYWAFLIGGEELADRGIVSPVVGMWSGNAVLFVIAMIMLYRVTFEERFSGFGWLQKFIQKFKNFREKRFHK